LNRMEEWREGGSKKRGGSFDGNAFISRIYLALSGPKFAKLFGIFVVSLFLLLCAVLRLLKGRERDSLLSCWMSALTTAHLFIHLPFFLPSSFLPPSLSPFLFSLLSNSLSLSLSFICFFCCCIYLPCSLPCFVHSLYGSQRQPSFT
jgi:hypothetical protein